MRPNNLVLSIAVILALVICGKQCLLEKALNPYDPSAHPCPVNGAPNGQESPCELNLLLMAKGMVSDSYVNVGPAQVPAEAPTSTRATSLDHRKRRVSHSNRDGRPPLDTRQDLLIAHLVVAPNAPPRLA